MAEQLASVPEESSTDFTALSPRTYSYRESFLSVAGSERRIRSTISSQSGQSGSNHFSIFAAGASSPYLFKVSGSASNLRYLFLLNNSYFVAQEVSEPSLLLDVKLWSLQRSRLKLIPECKKYMDSYLDVSWGHVVSSILPWNSRGQPKYSKKNSSLVKFQSMFHQTYQAQKFWKVPDPGLRSLLRENITKRVIPGYRDYLKEHPELEKHVRGGGNSPEILEKMLGELFEG